MQKINKLTNKLQKRKLLRNKGLSLYSALRRFYIEDFIQISKSYKRGFNLSIILLVIKLIQQYIILFNINITKNLQIIEDYLEIVDRYNVQQYLKNNISICNAFLYIFFSLNILILVYVFAKFIKTTINTSKKEKQLKLLNFIEEKEKNKRELTKNFDEIIFSMIFQTYNYIFLIPSILFSSIEMGQVASVNITLTIVIELLISNNEYDYMITSKDALRQKYIDFQMIFSFSETIAYFLVVLMNSNESMIVLWLYILSELTRLILLQPLFDRKIQNICIFLNTYLFLFISILYCLIKFANKSIHLLGVTLLLFFPLSYKLSMQIEEILTKINQRKFQERLNENTPIGADILNYIVRKVLLRLDDSSEKIQNLEEIQNISFLIKNNEIQSQLQKKELELMISAQRQKESGQNQQNYDMFFDDTNDTLLSGYEADTKHFDGKDYIVKEQVFGENVSMKRVVCLLFNDLFMKERNKKQFGLLDIYYLVFIVEILKNYQLFELTVIQMQKSISIKYLQILNSIMQEVEQRKNTMRLENDENQIFGTSYYEAIIYDELILQTQQNLEESVQKKVGLLLFMKQKFINLEDLQSHLEELLRLRDELIESITLMIRVNEYSHHLYDLYLNYLETLSFSESDIKIEKYNSYQNNQQQIFFELNSSDACVLYASLKSEKDVKVTKVSNNFEHFLGYEKQQIIGNQIESIMPLPYAEVHKNYLMGFFERGQTVSTLRNQLLFALSQSNHIVPVKIDVKVNMVSSEKEFGISAYIQRDLKQIQYILFDASTSRLVSMTQEINQFCFPLIKNFNRVSMTPYFPFIQHFRQIYANNSSNPLSRTSQLTMNSAKTKQFASNISIRSYQNEKLNKQIAKGKNQQQSEGSVKFIAKETAKQQAMKDREVKESAKSVFQSAKAAQPTNTNKIKPLKDFKNSVSNKHQNIVELYDESDDRRYRNIQYLLVVNTSISNMTSMKSKSVQGLGEYLFFTFNLNIYTVPSEDLEHIKYIEATQIKQINPLYNQKLILQIYNDEIEGFLTNLHSLKSSDIQCIISELEAKGIKDSNRYQEQQNITDLYQEQGSDVLLHSKHENNDELLYNRYASQDQAKLNPELLSSQINQKNNEIEKEDVEKGFASHLDEQLNQSVQSPQQSLKKQNLSFGEPNIQISQLEDVVKNNGKRQSELISIKKVENIQQQQQFNEKKFDHKDKRVSLDSSQYQLLKRNSEEVSTSFNGVNLKQSLINQELNESYFNGNPMMQNVSNIQYPQLINQDNSSFAVQGIDASEFKGFPYPFTPISPNAQTQNTPLSTQHATFFKFNPQEQNSTLEPAKRISGVDPSQFFSPKAEFFSPKELTSQHQLMNKSTTIMSPQNMQGQIQYAQFLSLEREMPLQNGAIPINQQPQISSGLLKQQQNNYHQSRQNTQSVRSLSKKRKQIQVKQKKEIKNLKEALETSSNHSRESSQSSTRQATKNIVLQKFTLNIMKVVNLIGIISFLIIIIVVLQQYLSMSYQFSQYSQDLDFVNWAPKYQLTIFQIRKTYNLNALNNNNILLLSNDDAVSNQFGLAIQTDLVNFVQDIRNLLLKMERQTTDRQLIKKMLTTDYVFKMASIIDKTKPLNQQPSNNFFNTVDMVIALYIGALRVFAYLFRYSRGLGQGIAQWIVVNNAESVINSLLIVAKQCQDFSIQQLTQIENDVNNVLIIICLVSAFCIFIIIPVYSFIQTKREQIIQLFGTFNTQFIDLTIAEISKIYLKNNNIKSLSIQNLSQENQKRQNLSSTSRLSRINKKIIFMALVIFLLTLPYPILNKVLSFRYISQNKNSLPMLEQIYGVQSFIVEQLSSGFFTMNFKNTANSPYKLSKYSDKYQKKYVIMDQIQVDFQNAFNDFSQISMFDNSLFQSFFLSTFSDDICKISQNYPDLFKVQNVTFTVDGCPQVFGGILKKGLQISLKTFFEVYRDFYISIIETDTQKSNDLFLKFQQNYDLQDYLLFQDYLVDILEALAQFILSQSSDHKLALENILLGLLLYQLLMMCCIFYFGWILFYQAMDEYLHKTKLYLALLNINYLISNPYIQNYLHKSLT